MRRGKGNRSDKRQKRRMLGWFGSEGRQVGRKRARGTSWSLMVETSADRGVFGYGVDGENEEATVAATGEGG